MSRREASGLVRRARSAALATALAGDEGFPYASLVTVATDIDGSPVLLLSELSDHTRNLKADGRAALLFEEAAGLANPQTGARVTVLGTVRMTDDERQRRRFLARHPDAFYAEFADFHIYAMTVSKAHWVGGFGKSVWFPADDLITDPQTAGNLAACETEVLAHMNEDHREAIGLYAQDLLGLPQGNWLMTGVDSEGCDLRCGDRYARLDFDERITDAASLRAVLINLARRARERQ